jgi:Rho termination factor, N-terminal domain
MHLSDSFYVALCMTILICAVVYWFWTQNQYVLRKLHLLNNIVFEMRTQLNKEEAFPDSFAKPTEYPPAPASVAGEDEDLLHEQLSEQVEAEADELPSKATGGGIVHFDEVEQNSGTPLDTLAETLGEPVADTFAERQADQYDDLAPGGSLGVQSDDSKPVNASNVLEGMTLKELRRLAEQRGVSGASSLKKAQLLTALREQKPLVEPFEATVSLS